jgi:hypothetical protein
MLVQVSDFPSGGYNYSIGYIDIHPMTYKDIIEYNSYLSNTFIQKLYRDIKCLDKDLGEDTVNSLLYYDFDFIMFTKKAISLIDPAKISLSCSCANCGSQFNFTISSDDLKYSEFNDDLKKIRGIKLGSNEKEYSIQMPTMRVIRSALDVFMKYKEDVNQEILLLCCSISEFETSPNEVKSMIENSIKDDIINLKYISEVFSGLFKECNYTCPTCKKGGVTRINNLMTDMFRLLSNNIEITKSKIIFSKGV